MRYDLLVIAEAMPTNLPNDHPKVIWKGMIEKNMTKWRGKNP